MKNNNLLITKSIIGIIFILLVAFPVFAKNHIITQTIEFLDNRIEMSPVIDFKSSMAIKEAIDNGVRINLIAKAQLYIPNNWWFDSVLVNKKQYIEVYYFKLGRLYVAKNITTNEQVSFNDYEEIWDKFEKIIVFEFEDVKLEDSWIRSKVVLDSSALPTTMQLPVLFNNEWNINTDWYSQKLQIVESNNE
jgi:hypothetical protein